MREPATYHLTLADGRKLSYTDTGTGENGTWIHCHGIPGSRYELAHITADLNASGLRVIVPDRPGYGDSTPHPDYGFLQHTNDVRQLADHLGLDRFSVSGFSGGGVFAMATANDLEERIERLTIAATPAVPLMKNPYAYASELTGNAWKAALDNPDKLAMDLQALTESAEILSEALMGNAGPEEYEYMCSEPFCRVFARALRPPPGRALLSQPGLSPGIPASLQASGLTARKISQCQLKLFTGNAMNLFICSTSAR